MAKPKIYLSCPDPEPNQNGLPDLVGYALAEDGHCLASHVSSSVEFAKHDLGLTSDCKHEHYNDHYPKGWELEWINHKDIIDKKHEGWSKAFKLNQEIFNRQEKEKKTQKGE